MEAFCLKPPDSSFTVIMAYLIQPYIHTAVDTTYAAAAATAPPGTTTVISTVFLSEIETLMRTYFIRMNSGNLNNFQCRTHYVGNS
jgi:hypothetical protein